MPSSNKYTRDGVLKVSLTREEWGKNQVIARKPDRVQKDKPKAKRVAKMDKVMDWRMKGRVCRDEGRWSSL